MTNKPTKTILENLIQSIEAKYTPDKRVEVFSIEICESCKGIELRGETTNKSAYQALIAQVNKAYPAVAINIRILPNEVIGEKRWGVIYNSVANIHSQASHKSDMVSQVLLGMVVRILNIIDDWLLVQAPDGYIGWISGSVKRLEYEELKNYIASPKVIVTNLYGMSYCKADIHSQSISDIVIGNIFLFKGEENDFFNVKYPNGRTAFLPKQNAMRVENWLGKIDLSGKSIVNRAKELMGIPYVWGGTSSKGLDCSGFTKIVYFMHGVIIPRDASQQVFCGNEVDNIGNFDKILKGDLVFFGEKASTENLKEKIVHVGIYIGNSHFIHASDYIHISSFNPEDKLFDEFNTNRYLRTKRYIGYQGTTGITPIVEHPFYNKG